MQTILENLREGSFLCLKVLTSCLLFSPTTLPLIDSSFNKIFKKSKTTKKSCNISWGHQEREKNFPFSSVIFIRFNWRATKYCKLLAERSTGTACELLRFKLRTLLICLKPDMLESNFYQQHYHKINIKQQKTSFINYFSTNNASGEGINSSSTIETLGFGRRFTCVWIKWPVLGVAVSDPAGTGTPCLHPAQRPILLPPRGKWARNHFHLFPAIPRCIWRKQSSACTPNDAMLVVFLMWKNTGAVFKSESESRQSGLFKISTSKLPFLFQESMQYWGESTFLPSSEGYRILCRTAASLK